MKAALAVLAVTAAVAAIAASPAAADEVSPDELLGRYQPVTVLDQGELFAPTSVDDFLADATLSGRPTTVATRPWRCRPPGCRSHGDGWRLDHRCAAIGGPARRGRSATTRHRSARASSTAGTR